MDITIRKNEKCIVGLPQCDYVFSSTRSCFIAYGYDDSPLEKDILCDLLTSKGIEPIEAGGALAPAQSAFCTKICSKIITAQFCIVLNNNKIDRDKEIPNANVNMEYGLMLGFNKLVIPFQKADQKLPFNVAGLDTIKYDDRSFRDRASRAIDDAVKITSQTSVIVVDNDQRLSTFLLTQNALISPLVTDDEKNLYNLGAPLGFNLLTDFSGSVGIYFGNFAMYRSEIIIWRLGILRDIISGRRKSINLRLEYGVINENQRSLAELIFKTMQIWVLVTSDDDKREVVGYVERNGFEYSVKVFTLDDISKFLNQIGT